MSQELRCYGCGNVLQSTDESKAGYVPSKVLETRESILCQRCFKLQHYNTNSEIQLVNEEFVSILKNVGKHDALIVYVIDIFAFESSLIENLSTYINNKQVLILANKRDLIPSSVNDEKLTNWIKHRLKDLGITNVIDVIISSGYTNYHTDLILDKFDALRNKKDVYIIGNSNVGKSTFINSLLKNYSNNTQNFITTSYFPGTTLNVINIPIDKNSYIYDTPGIITKNSMYYAVEPKILKYILPRKEIKPITFQLKTKQTLLLGGLANFSFIDGKDTNFTTYFSNFVNIVRCKHDKKDSTFNSFIKGKNIHPTSANITSNESLKKVKFDIDQTGKIDVVISGYGWISFEANKQTIELEVPTCCNVEIREAMI